MLFAIFGISNGALDLVVNLLVLFLVVVWLALIYWTYADAKRRLADPVLITCATGASLFPYIGTIVYTILRPPEFLDDAKERKLEIRAAELRVRALSEQACPHCEFPVEKSFLRCPNCKRRLKDPCESCGKPIGPRWAICPYCEAEVPRRERAAKAPTSRAEPRKDQPQRAQRTAARDRREKPSRDARRAAQKLQTDAERGERQAPPKKRPAPSADKPKEGSAPKEREASPTEDQPRRAPAS
jgi:hypothetical protein